MSETITIRCVYGADTDEPLNVEPGEADGCVRVVAAGEEAREYWGAIDFTMTYQHARDLAAALIACANEVAAS